MVHGVDRARGLAIVYPVDPMTGERGAPVVWPNALPPHRSPCRQDDGKGLHQHRCSVAHADLVESYRATAAAEEAAAEAATNGYDTELAEYWRDHPRTTFKMYLTHREAHQ